MTVETPEFIPADRLPRVILCRFCHRPLRADDSRERGSGPVCARYADETDSLPLGS